MKDKILTVFTSVRFLQLVVVATLQVLVVFNVIDSSQGEALTQIIQTLLLGSVAIGTLDSVAQKSATPAVAVKDSSLTVEAPSTVVTESAVKEDEPIQDLIDKLK